ncbi:2-methylcitrate synthase [Pseudomonadales bacterium]|jgi:2-methylcitrate synthase|nr:2-methylcitrate synthase [Pseudomonadales bacterium]MDB2508906.1 2-methylcitrate synthase [Pseudomonadales bacterium]MDB3979499.1 2-methylcitrate synthase [Pseudomonadales bacterium]MDC0375051.1 2-methylcitrate synthase [Pseudomonadales bacterium]MDC1101702.1 2-methylcitrate synthase [Pseudomonadales bacterium]
MMVDKKLGGAGLRGQSAGETALCTVGKEGAGLTYRGYTIEDLAANAKFEEVAYMLLYGELPTQDVLTAYETRLTGMRDLPEALKKVLEAIPKETHPMDVMRTGCSMLGNLEPETSFDEQHQAADRLLATLPAIICYWYRFSHDGVRISTDTGEDSIGGHFLKMLSDESPSDLHRAVMNASLILYAEHEFNASTFTARVCAATLSDMYSCITGAIGSLRGPLHGGANEAAMELIEKFGSVAEVEGELDAMLARKDLIMGFGHAIYRTSDPRNAVIKDWSSKLAAENGDTTLYDISCKIADTLWDRKALFPNADFFHASAYNYMGIPTKIFTPIFVMSRLTGWAAHVMEQRSNNRLIRPSADYIGPDIRPYQPIEAR